MSELIDKLINDGDPLSKEAAKEIVKLQNNLDQLYRKYVDLVFDYLAVKVKLEELQEKPYDGSSTDL